MHPPPYLMPRPVAPETAEIRAAFDLLYDEQVAMGTGGLITYTLEAPKWQFLCYLTDTKEVVLHGSINPDITEFEPRQAVDAYAFGNQRAVYAASDGIWPLYFALINTKRHKGVSRLNTCSRFVEPTGRLSEPYYFFSLNREVLRAEPWCSGTIYVLPRRTFVQEPVQNWNGVRHQSAQWASFEAAKPLARLPVEPDNFPFLEQTRGHDKERIAKLAREDPVGFPWLEEA
jgi:hypothetical protein